VRYAMRPTSRSWVSTVVNIYTRAQSLQADASGPATEEIPALGCGPVPASRYP